MPEFVTRRVGTAVDENDRLVRVYRTVCAGCGSVVTDKAARDSHRCPKKP